ncbi:epidermal retinol dehydrogenase 2-like [Euwallacea similis]|uniref:epidermal retinol dehydrogenase 2-like n=1 Tax=Euwallacea similis TaxID=1736056 RepID=UPI0034502494
MTYVMKEKPFVPSCPMPAFSEKTPFPSKREQRLLKSTTDVIMFLLVSIFYILKAVYKYLLPIKYKKQKELRGEVALITGGGSGLGRLLALRLAKLGVKIVLWDVSVQGVEETKKLVTDVGGTVYGYKCDVSNEDDVYRVAKQTSQVAGDITILINNAGVVSGQLLLDTPDYLIRRTFDVNVLAHFWTVKAFLPSMIENQHGHIVTVASMAGHAGINKLVDYCASKFATIGFDEALRVELEAQGIKGVITTAVCPYFISATGMFDSVESRFLPRLDSCDVADRIVEGIQANETMVLIPGWFRLGLILKSLIPWTVLSLFLRGLVPDAAPHQATLPKVATKEEEDDSEEELRSLPINRNNSITGSMTQLTHRYSPTGKNL